MKRNSFVNRYHKLSHKYLKEAKEAIRRNRISNASEKLWGAAAEIVKAVAQKNGWYNKDHNALFDVIMKISKRTGRYHLVDLFGLASSLHFNFYGDIFTIRHLKFSYHRIKYFINEMEKILKEA